MKLLSNGAQVATGLGLLSVASIALIQFASPSFAQTSAAGGTSAAPGAGMSSSNGTSTTPAPGTGATPGTNSTNANGDSSGISQGSASNTTTPGGMTPNTTITPAPNNSDTGIGTTPGSSTTMPGVGTNNPGVTGISPSPGYSTNMNPSVTTPGMGQGSMQGKSMQQMQGTNTPSMNSSMYNTPAAPITQDSMNGMNRFGGPMSDSAPDLDLTASFVGAGGGPYDFNIWMALKEMGGRQFAEDEKLTLQAQFGVEKTAMWADTFQFAVLDSYLQAKKSGVDFPINSTYMGPLLGMKVIEAGQDSDKTFYCGSFMDHTVSHGIHWQVMRDIDSMSGERSDHDFHMITNQAMVDLAHHLGWTSVKAGDVSDDYMMNNMNGSMNGTMNGNMNGTMPATPAQ